MCPPLCFRGLLLGIYFSMDKGIAAEETINSKIFEKPFSKSAICNRKKCKYRTSNNSQKKYHKLINFFASYNSKCLPSTSPQQPPTQPATKSHII